IADVSELLGLPPERLVKTLIYETDSGQLVVAVIRGDREINEVKLQNAVPDALHLRLAPEERVRELTGAPTGFAGPIGLRGSATPLMDLSVVGMSGFACGANAADEHLTGVDWQRDAA